MGAYVGLAKHVDSSWFPLGLFVGGWTIACVLVWSIRYSWYPLQSIGQTCPVESPMEISDGSQMMKRWYQLSMLQILIAMAVVSVLVWLNRPIPYRIHSYLGGMVSIGESQGWPICFRPVRWMGIPVILTPSAEPQATVVSPKRNIAQEIRLLPLLADMLFGAICTMATVLIVGQFRKKKVPPSTST